MQNFCTLFDTAYLHKGLALYDSLKQHIEKFHLYIVACDEQAYKILKQLNLEFATTISVGEIEKIDTELFAVKSTRSRVEYLWTMTPCIIHYIFSKYKTENCTYIDADIYFFNSPFELKEPIDKTSVTITPHWYTPKYDQSKTTGIYCVQYVYFRNNIEGNEVLSYWRKSCIEWCYNRSENGKFGDQKYLDVWPTLFPQVKVCEHRGFGVAAWNVQQYNIINSTKLFIQLTNKEKYEAVFYHFHYFHLRKNNQIDIGPYIINNQAYQYFYKPYIDKLIEKCIFLKNKFGLENEFILPLLPIKKKLRRIIHPCYRLNIKEYKK
ncbi:MAG: glycosyl transferase [Bacteroidetes bacterium]|nr:glycosyl transferase [Bacteroidota bacterium]